MIEKKTREELLAETPEAWRSQTSVRDERSPVGNGWADAQGGLRDLIARRAYELYEERGRIDGDDVNDWLMAEEQIRLSLGAAKERAAGMSKRRRQSTAS